MRCPSLSSALLVPMLVALLAGCGTTVVPATEVIVRVRVDDAVYAATTTLRIDVEGSADGITFDRLAHMGSARSVPLPSEEVRVALAPLNGDATRLYRVTATALDGAGVAVSVARVISGYRLGATLEYELVLVGRCISVVCSALETCRGTDSACVDARVRVTDLPPLRRDGGVVDLGGPADLGALDGGAGDLGAADLGRADLGADLGCPFLAPGCSVPTYLKASNTDAADNLGYSLSLSADGTRLAVGAVSEASSATGVDGNQADNTFMNSGAVYVFSRTGTTWRQEAYIKASNTGAQDSFGYSVSLSADGTRLAVGAPSEDSSATGVGGDQLDNGAPGSGAVYLFARTGATWTQEAYVKASNAEAGDAFGIAVSLSADGAWLVAGAVFEASSDVGVGGRQSDNGAPSSGAVYVFSRSGTSWSQQAYVKASNTDADDYFGIPLSLSSDGTRLAVGATQEDSSATGIGGNQLDNSVPFSGAVYVFSRTGTTWAQEVYVKASNSGADDFFGYSVSLSADGTRLAAGAFGEASRATGVGGIQTDNSSSRSGAVYVYSRVAGVWMQDAYIKASNTAAGDEFGFVVSLSADGTQLAVAAYREDSVATGIGGDQADNSAINSGASYVFSRTGATWTQVTYLKASNTGAGDELGRSLSLSADGTHLAVGAFGEGSNATGVGGNQADNSAFASGAVYVY